MTIGSTVYSQQTLQCMYLIKNTTVVFIQLHFLSKIFFRNIPDIYTYFKTLPSSPYPFLLGLQTLPYRKIKMKLWAICYFLIFLTASLTLYLLHTVLSSSTFVVSHCTINNNITSLIPQFQIFILIYHPRLVINHPSKVFFPFHFCFPSLSFLFGLSFIQISPASILALPPLSIKTFHFLLAKLCQNYNGLSASIDCAL